MGSLRSAVQVVKKRRTIELLQARLADCQTKYHLALTADTRDKVLRLLEDQGKSNESMRDIILRQIDNAKSASEASHSITHDRLHTLGKDLSQATGRMQQQLSTLNADQQSTSKALKSGQLALGKEIYGHFARTSNSSKHQDFLNSLSFEGMFARQETIKKNLPGTYEWVRDGRLPQEQTQHMSTLERDMDQENRGSIARWLRSKDEDRVFWVSGKPGSGKSSLMAFVMTNLHTLDCVGDWAGGNTAYIFSFFFWKPGSTLQRTKSGLWRSLLWQLCKARSQTIDTLLSHDPSFLYSPWAEARLVEALGFVLSAYSDDPILFIIDGLDECEESHSELIRETRKLIIGERFKVCLSSRPQGAFKQQLAKMPSIRLEDVNYGDIYQYAYVKLKGDGSSTTSMADTIAQRAEGVFLWAVLVCESLLSGFEAKDDDDTMLERLRAFPDGLERLFAQMFDEIEQLHHESLALYFHAALQDYATLAMITAGHAKEEIVNLEHFGSLCEREADRITMQSKGLLQINSRHLYRVYHDVDKIYAKPSGSISRQSFDHGWSLSGLPSGRPKQGTLAYEECHHVLKNMRLAISFVHRSAYDYMSKDSGNKFPVWLQSADTSRIHGVMLKGILWLARHGPLMTVARQRLSIVNWWRPSTAFIFEDVTLQSQLLDGLKELHDALDLWKTEQTLTSANLLLRNLRPGGMPAAHVPLSMFWTNVLAMRPDYLSSNLHRLLNQNDIYINICSVLSLWSRETGLLARRTDVNDAVHSVMTGIDFKERNASPSSLRTMWGYSLGSHICGSAEFFVEGFLLSWYGTDAHDEPSIVSQLWQTACCLTEGHGKDLSSYGGAERPKLPEYDVSKDIDILAGLCGMINTWKLFVAATEFNDEAPLPLQISLPVMHATPKPYHSAADMLYQHVLSHRSVLRLRLLCFMRSGSQSLKPCWERGKPISPVGSYELSPTTTTILMRYSIKNWNNSISMPRFVGTMPERSRCTDIVMAELWENAEKRLTAWEQLYIRACVKTYFAYFWREDRKGWRLD